LKVWIGARAWPTSLLHPPCPREPTPRLAAVDLSGSDQAAFVISVSLSVSSRARSSLIIPGALSKKEAGDTCVRAPFTPDQHSPVFATYTRHQYNDLPKERKP
jgi:hypothetical protein